MTFLLALLIPVLALADSFSGKVIAVTDGDTIKVLREGNVMEKIRLLGIDAPEKKQAYGPQSKQNLSQRIFGKVVTVDYKKRDQYGRTLGKILLGEEDVNLFQIQTGFAWHYKQYAREQDPADAAAYAKAQELAEGAGLGLWASANPTPPWDYRRERKVASRMHPKTKKHRSPRPRRHSSMLHDAWVF